MDFKNFVVKNIMMSFFVSVACICAAMAILGIFFAPDARFGYEALLSPLIFGAAAALPSLVNYSKHELSIRAAALRKLFQFVLIECIVLFIVYYSSGGTLNGGTLSGGTLSGGTLSGGTLSGGTLSGGTLSGGTLSGGTLSGGTLSGELTISLALSVLLIFGAVHLVLWINDRKTAEAFNAALKEMQQQLEHTK